MVFHDLYTNGIAYLNLLFDTAQIPDALVPYLGLLKAVLGYVDTEHYTYGELFHEIHANSGGVYCGLHVFEQEEKGCRMFFGVKAKCLYSQLEFVFRMIREMLCTSKVRDEKRMREILARQRSRLEVSLAENGHVTAMSRSSAYFSPAFAFQDRTSGIDYYWFAADLEQHFDEKKEEIFDSLECLIRMIFRPKNLLVSFTADEAGYEKLASPLAHLEEVLFRDEAEKGSFCFQAEQKNEGFKTAGQVQYAAVSGNYREAGFDYTGAFRILKVLFNYEYLWTNIRVKGGAYGCMSGFRRNGDSYLVSYRDPNLAKTLEVYRGAAEYLRNYQADEEEMTKYVIGTISDMDVPLTPAGKGSMSMTAYLCGVTQEMLQRERDQVLNASVEEIRALAEPIEAVVAQNNLCVIGSESAVEEKAWELFGQVKTLVR